MTIKKIEGNEELDLLIGMREFDAVFTQQGLQENLRVKGFLHRGKWCFNVNTTHEGVDGHGVIAVPLEFFENIINRAKELDKLRAEVIDDVI